MTEQEQEKYIGDGVYASFDGWQIKLRTARDDRDDVIYLEPEVYAGLMVFARQCWERTAEKKDER